MARRWVARRSPEGKMKDLKYTEGRLTGLKEDDWTRATMSALSFTAVGSGNGVMNIQMFLIMHKFHKQLHDR